MADDAMSDYPVTFDVAYPESPSRWLILIRWLLAIPHYIVLAILAAALAAVEVIVLFTILLAKTFPDRLYRFTVGVNRWALNVGAYVLFLDRYPPFSMNEGAYPGVTFTVERPEDLNRWSVLGEVVAGDPARDRAGCPRRHCGRRSDPVRHRGPGHGSLPARAVRLPTSASAAGTRG